MACIKIDISSTVSFEVEVEMATVWRC